MDSAIDISSDSDVEIQEIKPRPLRITEGSHRPVFMNGSSSNGVRNGKLALTNGFETKPRMEHRNGFEIKPRMEHRTHFTGNGNIGGSRVLNGSVGDYKNLQPQQGFKMIRPPPIPVKPEIGGTSNGSASYFRGDYGIPASGIKIDESYGGPHDGIGIGRVINGGTRILPPFMMHGAASSSSSHFNVGSDPMHRNGFGEERNSENDERLIYHAALQDLNQPKSEMDLPPGLLAVPLMKHQRIALAWMFHKESRSGPCRGGILADDQGLGKTVSTIALILKEMYEAKVKSESLSNQETEALDLDADDESEIAFEKLEPKASNGNGVNGGISFKKAKDKEASTSTRRTSKKRPGAGTLIVCPASIMRQWARELDEKITYDAKLSVLIYHGGNRTKDPNELAKYDVVMTTYAIVANEVPKKLMADEDENDEKNAEKYGLASGFSKKRKIESDTTKKSKKRGKKNADDPDLDCGTLAKVVWLRVVLDEAQTIKNHRTKVARACSGLKAKRRWCLSGTPIQNTVDDLFSYFRFLKYDPYSSYKSFCNGIKVPITRNAVNGYKKLQAILKAIMLRRTKGTLLDGQPIISLPPKTISMTKVDFSEEERSFYKKLESDSKMQFKAYEDAGTLNQNYANILLMLLRLRQACDHPQLVKRSSSDSVGKKSEEAAKKLPVDTRVYLLSRLESSPICCVCGDPPEDPCITLCRHIYCYQCVSDFIKGDENTCHVPRCREELAHEAVFSESTLKNSIANDSGSTSSHDKRLDKAVLQNREFSSSKVKALLEILQSLSNEGSSNSVQHSQVSSSLKANDDDDVTIVEQKSLPSSSSLKPYDNDDDVTIVEQKSLPSSSSLKPYDDDDVTIVEPKSLPLSSSNRGSIKTIIFSQWTGMLDLVELMLNENAIEFRRLDGKMSLPARDQAVKQFSNDPAVTVMIMSLKAGNLGLNMVAACHVILLDLWWNPTTEDQAIDRAHRIGQTKAVTVTRMTVKDTVEDRILALQESKRDMVANAFGEDRGGNSATRLTVDDLKYLFQV